MTGPDRIITWSANLGAGTISVINSRRIVHPYALTHLFLQRLTTSNQALQIRMFISPLENPTANLVGPGQAIFKSYGGDEYFSLYNQPMDIPLYIPAFEGNDFLNIHLTNPDGANAMVYSITAIISPP